MFQDSLRPSLPRRNAVVADKFGPQTTIQHLLIYFDEDKSYEILCSNSCLLPIDFNVKSVRVKDKIFVKPGLLGLLIAKSDTYRDMEIYKRRLEKKLDEGVNVANSSLNFLNNSSSCEQQTPEDVGADMDSDHDTISVIDTVSKNSHECNVSYNCCKTCHNLGQSQNELLARILKTQNGIIKQLKKSPKPNHSIDGNYDVSKMQSVYYQEENLTLSGNPRMPPSMYGQCIARKLFSDDELANSMLFPVRETGRRSLSPSRSDIFKRAVSARFNDDQDAIQTSISAVNQLGIDIKRGRRKRKS